ncbi:hypothetical protein AB0A74_38960 [Saccharothrix sp. NPDC042600]|uniref:hypothetical protein n=1 Tax=Saccharothrix TaxID=2071 RepID=UPI00340C3439|nr:hypothetical protein GCM10017745_51260 [Saccharothrix mutabilis subsp. capreolus]
MAGSPRSHGDGGRRARQPLRVDADAFTRRHPATARDAPGASVLRNVLLKPESEDHLALIHHRVEHFAAQTADRVGIHR